MAWRDLLARVSISDVMQPCSVFVRSGDLVTKARAVMRSSGLRTLPVIDGGRLEGIITSRHVMRITSTRSNIPVAGLMFSPRLIATPAGDLAKLAKEMVGLGISNVPVVQSYGDKTVVGLVRFDGILKRLAGVMKPSLVVGELMTRKVVTCGPEDELPYVWDIMERTHYSGLPVARYNRRKHANEVIGVITRSDIIRSGATRLAEESTKGKGRFRNPPRVRSLMRTPAITATPEMPVSKAIDLMLGRGIGRLPVVEGGKLVGIISRSDVIKAACG